jgi:hypothetical protein
VTQVGLYPRQRRDARDSKQRFSECGTMLESHYGQYRERLGPHVTLCWLPTLGPH